MAEAPSVAIIGAGFSGICAAVRLKQAGYERITIYEKAERVGGTWHYNTYPGCACDVRVQLYSLSFEPNGEWDYVFARSNEIQAYLEGVVDKHDLRPHLRLSTPVKAARWDEAAACWRLTVGADEEAAADIVITGFGQLDRPHFPDIPGRDSFAGASFHSARWDHGVSLKGKRVGVIGTAASAVQFIPEIAPDVAHLDVFQRSANYLLPRGDRPIGAGEKRLLKAAPWLMGVIRRQIYWWSEWLFWGAFKPGDWRADYFHNLSMKHLETQVPDPALRARLTPDYPIGCKRIIFSDDYYPALMRSNVALITDPIASITPEGVATKSGRTHALDVLIYGTGYEASDFRWSCEIRGKGGVDLREAWRKGPEAYLGVSVAGFPNFFMLYGPNTNLGHTSILFMVERQVEYVIALLDAMRTQDLVALEVTKMAQDRYNYLLQDDLARTPWAGACASWYKTASGKITNNWSGSTQDYKKRMRTPNFDDYKMRARAA
ncbi:MAG: NAD(P)/FAD-dependent oxidoreductase [Hyphomonadaceae bacterium]|nr:NAD(P)/FAD-dependent oxidoreductase [Hyphomonadaceae bacterium]